MFILMSAREMSNWKINRRLAHSYNYHQYRQRLNSSQSHCVEIMTAEKVAAQSRDTLSTNQTSYILKRRTTREPTQNPTNFPQSQDRILLARRRRQQETTVRHITHSQSVSLLFSQEIQI
jgi:hypothetical protein